MSSPNDIEKRRRPVAEEVPGIRVARLRKLAVPCGADGRMRVVLAAPGGKQEIVLVRRWRGFGYVYEAQCKCGHRALILRLDGATGWWRCARCLGLRCARSMSRGRHLFADVVLPILLVERRRRRLGRRGGGRESRIRAHEQLPAVEKRAIEQAELALQKMIAERTTGGSRTRGVGGETEVGA